MLARTVASKSSGVPSPGSVPSSPSAVAHLVGYERFVNGIVQPPNDECGRSGFHQKGRVDLVGRIIEGDDQIQSAIESRDPAMSGAVLVQHHSGQRLARPLAPVCSTPRRLLKVTAVLEISLGPAVAPAEALGLHQVLVEVLAVNPS
jgi:hypothetical protein